jgi:hypothetical protein
MTREEKVQIIRTQVEDYLNTNWLMCGIPHSTMANEEERNHIINCATEIMVNKCGIESYPGSFVTAIIQNNLIDAVSHADHVNGQALKFYAIMFHNMGIKGLKP